MNDGAVFTNCRYEHSTLFTAVGHATMSTGTYPFMHGIIANDWYDRTSGRVVYAVEDSFGTEPGSFKTTSRYGRSPQYLFGTTIGDEIKLHFGERSKVYSVSNKDRSAIMMAGRLANGAFWIDVGDGRWISSRHYMNEYPVWLNSYNKSRPLDKWFGKTWNLLLDSTLYPKIDPDIAVHYDVSHTMEKYFPHLIGTGKKPDRNYYMALRTSPFGAEALNNFVSVLMKEENIGKDSVPDLLCVSYSTGDYIGHEYGPYSKEVMDYVLRLDRYLDSLFSMIDNSVGWEQTIVVLTSDHGIAPLPKVMEKKGFPIKYISRDSVSNRINLKMTAKYGPAGIASGFVIAEEPNFYFNPRVLKEKNIDKLEAENYIKNTIVDEQWDGVFRVYTYHDLLNGSVPNDEVSDRVQRSFHPARSGDLFFVLLPYHTWFYNGKGTEHGALYAYDTHVPLLWYGKSWIKPGRYNEETSPVYIAPTLSVILKTGFPSGVVGKVIVPCLK